MSNLLKSVSEALSSRIARVAAVAFAALCFLTPASFAQGAEAVASPLTTKRLERLLAMHVRPTEQEAAAIDRLHEAYLAKFRAELDPEISALTKSFGSGMPSQAEFEKFLRDLSRLQNKIGEADNAFLDSAAELVAEDRRAGLQRVREARERQRNLSGMTRMAPMMFGGGMAFVDLADVLSRSEYMREVPASAREQFDTLLRSQEQRILAQSRLYNSEILRALKLVYDVSTEMQAAAAAAEAGDPAAQAAAQTELMQRMITRMREIGAEPNRLAGATIDANRQAIRQFASVLSESAYHKLRADVARRSMGSLVSLSIGGFEEAQSVNPAAIIARLRRDPEMNADARALLDPIEVSWRRDRADITERIVDLCRQLDMTSMMTGGANGGANETVTEIQRLVITRADAAQRAYAAIAAAIGPDKSADFLATDKRMKPDAAGGLEEVAVLVPHQVEAVIPEPESWYETPSVAGVGSVNVAPKAWTARELARMFQPLGMPEASFAVLEGVVDGWRASEWDAKVVPLGTALSDATAKLYSTAANGAEGGKPVDQADLAKIDGLRRQLVEAVFAADAALGAELQAALGVAADSAELLCLRLERAPFAASSPAFSPEGTRRIASPAAILERADVSPETARAFFEKSRDAWKTFADELPAKARAGLDRAERQQAAMRAAQENSDWQPFQALVAANDAFAREYFSAYDALCDEAAAKANDQSAATGPIKQARLALAFPDVYASADSALFQLNSALRLDGLAEDQRARLEAVLAEYEAVYTALSEKLATDGGSFDNSDVEAWRAMQERMEAKQKLRFQRDERTEKARAEARRILGDELASRVRGLVRDENAPPRATAAHGFDPFMPEDD